MRQEDFTPTNTPFELSKYEDPYQVRRVSILADLIPAGNGRLAVDIGCGPGYFSKHLVDKKWLTTSIDTDPENIKSTSRFSQETRLGDAISTLQSFPEGKFDFALMLELIEHMPKEYGTKLLEQVIRTLKPGGQLLISTPNRHSLEGLSGRIWEMRGAGKWTAWDKTHVYIYSGGEFISFLTQCGFKVEKVVGYYYQGDFPLIGSVKLPIEKSETFPLNRLGFNIMLQCTKA